jgi:hypothetical protein
MRSNTSPLPARRTLRTAARRSRRRPAIIATGLAFAVIAAAGTSVALPTTQAQAGGASEDFALASYSVPLEPAPTGVAGDKTSVDARAALIAAKATIASAEKITSDIESSGLDVGVPVTSVDTDRLEAAVEHLQDATLLPAPLVSAFSTKVTDAIASVDADVNGLRGRLDAAIALKAEQEAAAAAAAAQAAAEAAAAAAAAEAAAAEAAQAAEASSAVSNPSPVYAGAGTSAGEAQAIARGMLGGYGWGDDQFGCLVALWDRESGWNSQAYNSSSGAYGIPQALPGSKMATAGADWQTNAATQISWGLGYIAGRYGTPCGAWNHSESVGWY